MSDRVSVIVPVYNAEKYVAEALESVLAQTAPPFEIIAVDDGSTDRSAEIVRGFGARVRYHHQANANTAGARNTGVRLAQGELYAFLDADDIWLPGKLALQTEYLAAHPEVDAVYGHVVQFHSPDLDAATRERIQCPTEPQPGSLVTQGLFRRAAVERIGPFDTSVTLGADFAWAIRARELGLRSVTLPEVVYRRRLHADNKGRRLADQATDRARILKAALDRRRAQK